MTNLPEDIEAILAELTLEEQVKLLSGMDFWSVAPIKRLGLGRLRVTDGPNGARGSGSLVGGVTAAAFPVGIALGATWDPDLVQRIGIALAQEVRSKGAHVSLAPTVNIHRSVTNGRNFECYSEDPELSAALASAYIRGLQSQGVAATIKHFAGNESEVERNTVDTICDETVLREIYLRPFEAAVKDAGTWGVMSSYNRLNGTFASENPWLLTQVLREDWGFDGVVMSDWYGSHTTQASVAAGLDLEMPGPTRDRGAKLVAAVQDGDLPADDVERAARNMLRLMARTGALRDTAPLQERADNRPEHQALIREAGAAGMVLLKNDTQILPLSDTGRVAVVGPNASQARIMGGGSAQLNPHYAISPLDGLSARLGGNRLSHSEGCTNHRWEPLVSGEFEVSFFDNLDLSGAPVASDTLTELIAFWTPGVAGGAVNPEAFSARVTGTYKPQASGVHRVGIHSAGLSRIYIDGQLVADAWTDWAPGRTFFEFGCDEVVGEVTLTAGQAHEVVVEFQRQPREGAGFGAWRAGIGKPMGDAEIAEAARLASDADIAVVCVGRSGEWDTEGSDLDNITLPGRQDDLVAAVAAANPRTVVVLQTGGPCEMPWIDDVAAVLQAWYPGQECGNAIADVLYGVTEPSGRLPQSFPRVWSDNPTASDDPRVYPVQDGAVEYREGLHIGYRHYAAKEIAPLFPFGHGLGYTDFEMGDMRVTEGQTCVIEIPVTNTGLRTGSTVVQVYVTDKAAKVDRPMLALQGFAKVLVASGETVLARVDLGPRAFAHCDAVAGCWRIANGTYTIQVGFSATDLRQKSDITRQESTLPY